MVRVGLQYIIVSICNVPQSERNVCVCVCVCVCECVKWQVKGIDSAP